MSESLQEFRDRSIGTPSGAAALREGASSEALDHGLIESMADWQLRDEAAQLVAAFLDVAVLAETAPPGVSLTEASGRIAATAGVGVAFTPEEVAALCQVRPSDPIAEMLGLPGGDEKVSAQRMAIAYSVADALAYLFEGNAIDMLNSLADLPTTDDEHDDYRSPFDPDTDSEDLPF